MSIIYLDRFPLTSHLWTGVVTVATFTATVGSFAISNGLVDAERIPENGICTVHLAEKYPENHCCTCASNPWAGAGNG